MSGVRGNPDRAVMRQKAFGMCKPDEIFTFIPQRADARALCCKAGRTICTHRLRPPVAVLPPRPAGGPTSGIPRALPWRNRNFCAVFRYIPLPCGRWPIDLQNLTSPCIGANRFCYSQIVGPNQVSP